MTQEIANLIKAEGWEVIRRGKDYNVLVDGKPYPPTHPFLIHSKIYREADEPEIKYQHLKRMHDLLWPEYTKSWNYWDERCFRAHCEGHQYIVQAGGASSGKDQPLWCKVRTPIGWTTIGECKVGDIICAPDGTTQTIIALHPQGKKEIYKLTFSDGTTTYASGTHLWQVQSKKQRDRGQGKYHIYSTLDLQKNITTRLCVPNIHPVAGIKATLLIDPWLLGYYIANGTSTSNVSITTSDKEVAARIQSILPEAKEWRSSSNCFLIGLQSEFKHLLQQYPSLYKKTIPTAYLYADKDSRLALLQGLMDGDGYISGAGAAISLSNKTLAEQVLDLARGLGYAASISGPHQTSYTTNGIKHVCSFAYKLYLSIPQELPCPFSLKRKQLPKNKRICRRTVIKIEPWGIEETQCITVSGESGLYITDDYIVTHNSNRAARLSLLFWLADPENRTVLIASTSLESLNSRIFGYCIRFLSEMEVPLVYHYRRGIPPKILYNENDKIHGIYAVAAKVGDDDKAIRDIIGRHPNRAMLVILDEATDMPTALLKSLPNLAAGGIFFQCMAIGNSNSKFDLHGSLATPKDGWDSIDPMKTNRWETTQDRGICLFFSCYESPAIWEQDPVKKEILSHFLITQEQIDAKKKLYGEDSDSFYRFVLGYWRSDSTDDVVLSGTFLNEFSVRKNAEWSGFYQLQIVAGLDVAFSTGGDQCLLRLGILGQDTQGRIILDFRGQELLFKINLSAASSRSAELQIADEVLRLLEEFRCPLSNLAVDASGQGRALGEVIKLRANSLESPVKIYSTKIGNVAQKSFDVVIRNTLELWTSIRDFIQTDQLRGIDEVTISQLTSRLIKTQKSSGKRVLESKLEYKSRMGSIAPSLAHSPDEADSLALCLQAAMIRYGFTPGQRKDTLKQESFELQKWYSHLMGARSEQESHKRASPPIADFSGEIPSSDFNTLK